ncbi:lysine--tRNA ligase [Candidatus Uhrbacteria bacterium]|nr:lysine--tRNA ligase [Candidatus Uhrbacteria bacterium]
MSQIEELEFRTKKLESLRELGINPYPSVTKRTHTCHECVVRFDEFVESNQTVSLCGRLRLMRKHGGSIFLTIEDETSQFQLYVKKDNVSQNEFTLTSELLDIGDFVQAEGTVFRTRLGEKTLHVHSISLLTKTLLPLPEKWHGLSDVETRYRKRYLDLITNPSVRDIFCKRSLLIKEIRSFFEERGFMEVETPILQAIPGGAMARPFVTHHNTLDQDMYLRIAPELHLKRLIVGGFEKVFEIGKNFRNEGIDHSHNPEFTELEAYMAYADYTILENLIEELIVRLLVKVPTDTLHVTVPFPRIPYLSALQHATGISQTTLRDETDLRTECIKRGVQKEVTISHSVLLDYLTKTHVLPTMSAPTFLVDHPVALSPLSKRKSDDNALVERFQLIIEGKEIVNAFSELNDPCDQAERFTEQEKNRSKGDQETHPKDDEFIEALRHGLPPTAGLGIGIDRLIALFVGAHNLKEVILFPTLRDVNSVSE